MNLGIKHIDKQKNNTRILFLDLADAFDIISVPHKILRELQYWQFWKYIYGIDDCVLELISWTGEEFPVDYGVPQGIILDPTLPPMYRNGQCRLSPPLEKIITCSDNNRIIF